MYPALRVRKSEAEEVRKKLFEIRAVDGERRFIRRGDWVEIPLREGSTEKAGIYGEIIAQKKPVFKERPPAPFELIKKSLDVPYPDILPRKWELFGDVLIFRIPKELEEYGFDIARAYAEVLGAKTVLRDVGGIEGEYREPVVEFLLGDDAETIHTENGVRFKFDASKIMFSSGNIDERIRMAYVSNRRETVVDMFAGIGYFSVPMAVHSRPEKIYACEKNPVSFGYLKENIGLNSVEDIIEPILGDNREVCPENVADRVIMGYVGSTDLFLPYAFRALKSEGIVHYHETCPEELLPDRPISRLKSAAKSAGYRVIGANIRKIKSYAPGIIHIVVDAKIRPWNEENMP